MSFLDWYFGRNLKCSRYLFRHENGAEKTIFAQSESDAIRRMRHFVCGKMFGDWAFFYDKTALDSEMSKIKLVEKPKAEVSS